MAAIPVTKIFQFTGHQNAIYTLHPSRNAGCFYSAGADGLVVEWNGTAPGDGQLIARVGKPVYALCLLPGEHTLVVGTAQGNLHLIDLDQQKEVRNIEAHQGGIFSLLLVDGILITGGEDGWVKQWDLHTWSLMRSVRVSEKSIRTIVRSPENAALVIGSSDFHIHWLDLAHFSTEKTLPAHRQSVFALAYQPAGNHLVSGGRDAHLNVWDARNGYGQLQSIPAHTLHINSILSNPSGKRFATASMDKTVKIWDWSDYSLLKVIDKAKLDGHLSSVNALLWLSETRLLSASDDRTVMLWDIPA